VYDAVIRAVGLVRLPGGRRGGHRHHSLMANVDILPTCLNMLGLKAPDGIDGRAINLEAGRAISAEAVRFAEATQPSEGIEIDPVWFNKTKTKCARRGRFKYIWTPWGMEWPNRLIRNREELYDLQSDPCEQINLLDQPSREHRTAADQLRRALEAWSDKADPLPSEFDREQHDETIRILKAMGYLGGTKEPRAEEEIEASPPEF
jgi:arylsulfatase A-like enzyme